MSLNGNYEGGWGSGSMFWDQPGLDAPVDYQSVEGEGIEATPSHPPETPPPTPTPGVDIFDLNLSEIVTDTTQSALVGQQQLLQAVASKPNITLSDCNWTIGGDVEGSYDPSGTSAEPSPAVTSDVQRVGFFWSSSGSNTASSNDGVSVTCAGTSTGDLSASATYSVEQPVFAVVPTYEPSPDIQPCSDGTYKSGYWVAYRTTCSAGYGPYWTYTVTPPPGTGGQIAMDQLVWINPWIQPTPSATPSPIYTTGGTYPEDTGFPYAEATPVDTPWVAYDYPGFPLNTTPYELCNDVSFEDYWMYLQTRTI